MAKSINCPHCRAPLKIFPGQEVLTCEYCGHQAKQTVFAEPAPPPLVERSPFEAQQQVGRVRRTLLAVLLPAVGLPLVLGVLIPVLVCNQALRQQRAHELSQMGVMPGESEPDQLLAAKLGVHVDCLNAFAEQARSAEQRYLSWVDRAAGPDCSSRCVGWGIHEVRVYNDGCEKGLDRVRDAQPRMPVLDRGGDALLAAFKALSALAGQTYRYYNEKDYLDDGCAKGRALHAPLLAAFERFAEAEGQVRGVLEREYPALLARRAQQARAGDEAQGPAIAACYEMVLEARKLVQISEALEGGRRSDGDVAAARALLERLEAAIAAGAQAEERVPEDQRRIGYFLFPYRFNTHVKDAALELVKAGKAHVRKAAGTGAGDEATFKAVIEKYNWMLRWIKGAGPALPGLPDGHRCS